jgi:hypothetical protein
LGSLIARRRETFADAGARGAAIASDSAAANQSRATASASLQTIAASALRTSIVRVRMSLFATTEFSRVARVLEIDRSENF